MVQHGLPVEMNRMQAGLISDGDQMPPHPLPYCHLEVWIVAEHQACAVTMLQQHRFCELASMFVLESHCAYLGITRVTQALRGTRWSQGRVTAWECRHSLPLMQDLRSVSDLAELLLNHVSVSSDI